MSRLPRLTRRSHGIWRDTGAAWLQTLAAWQSLPFHFAAAVLLWGLLRAIFLRELAQVHLAPGGGPTLIEAPRLLATALAADLGPLIMAAVLWPLQHRRLLQAPAPRRATEAARAARMFAAAGLLAIAAAAVLGVMEAVPALAQAAIGRVSAILTAILLLPASCLTLTWLLRLCLGLPAISLGLPCALAEGWAIGRFHMARTLCVWVLAFAPISLTLLLAAQLDELGWFATLVRPLFDVAAVSLTGSLTGLFYRAMRLPREFRPDVRPSWNSAMRREPLIKRPEALPLDPAGA